MCRAIFLFFLCFCHYYIFAKTPFVTVLLPRRIWDAVRECFLIFCHYYIFAKTPCFIVLLSRRIWDAVRGMFSYSLPLLCFHENSLFSVLLSRNKSTKSSPLKRRDGSGKRQQTTNCQILMPALSFYGVYDAYIKICITVLNIFYCSCPALTSLLRRGGLPLT